MDAALRIRVTNPRNGLSKAIDMTEYSRDDVFKTVDTYRDAGFWIRWEVDGISIPFLSLMFALSDDLDTARINREDI